MFRRLLRLGEQIATFTEWARVYPLIFTKDGRQSLVDDLLFLGSFDPAYLDEMVEYANQIFDLKEIVRVRREPPVAAETSDMVEAEAEEKAARKGAAKKIAAQRAEVEEQLSQNI